MRKILKRSLITLATAAAGVVGLGHLSTQIIKALSPTPEEFAVAQLGKPFGPKATAILKSHDSIFVMQPESFAFKAYRYTHPLVNLSDAFSDIDQDSMYIPAPWMKALGEATFMVINGSGKDTSIDGIRPEDLKIFDHVNLVATIFHELGHHQLYKELGDQMYDLPILEQEVYGDNYSIQGLSDEFNGESARFTHAARAIMMFDQTHDTLPYLFKNATTPPQPADDKQKYKYRESRIAFSATIIDCLSPKEYGQMRDAMSNDKQIPPNVYDAFYACLKTDEALLKKHASDFNPADRSIRFIQSYEYFRGIN